MRSPYGESPSVALLTDLYQLTMAYGYWKAGRAESESVFHLFFRRCPFGGGYAIACGLEPVIDYLESFGFDSSDVAYLATLTGADDAPLFEPAFLDYLRALRLTVDVDGVPEGTGVFAHAPLLRVRGPLLQGQIIETPLLNLINFSTLIATKSARICDAARGEPVLDFGLRRAQGPDGSLTASRAAYVGGCAATSNVLAGKLHGIPVRGTHAHSWIMAYGDEVAAFEAFAAAMPANCIFLVDTYDTIAGVKHAITVGQRMRQRGAEMVGIRLDSGDLAELSIAARRLLDDAGFGEAMIVASDDLDEHRIRALKAQGATISVWGVGTRLVTGHDQPALGGVYKLTAIRESDGAWRPMLKLSEQPIKISTPGILQVRRFAGPDGLVADMIFDERDLVDPPAPVSLGPQAEPFALPPDATHQDLLVPVLRGGRRVYEVVPLDAVRDRTLAQLDALPAAVRRVDEPSAYPVLMDKTLHRRKARLVAEARGQGQPQTRE